MQSVCSWRIELYLYTYNIISNYIIFGIAHMQLLSYIV